MITREQKADLTERIVHVLQAHEREMRARRTVDGLSAQPATAEGVSEIGRAGIALRSACATTRGTAAQIANLLEDLWSQESTALTRSFTEALDRHIGELTEAAIARTLPNAIEAALPDAIDTLLDKRRSGAGV